jgi:hypothetical protein
MPQMTSSYSATTKLYTGRGPCASETLASSRGVAGKTSATGIPIDDHRRLYGSVELFEKLQLACYLYRLDVSDSASVDINDREGHP